MAEVVNRQTDTLIAHPELLIELKQQDRDQGRLPIVAMNDVRTLTGHQHELQRRLAEERKPCNVVICAVQMPTLKEALPRVRLDEEALAAVDPAEPHRAMNRAVEPWHPQIIVGDGQPVEPVIAQTVIFGQHDLD